MIRLQDYGGNGSPTWSSTDYQVLLEAIRLMMQDHSQYKTELYINDILIYTHFND